MVIEQPVYVLTQDIGRVKGKGIVSKMYVFGLTHET